MIRMGIGFDVHTFAEGRELVLGGERFEDCTGLAGHSDADVLSHAIMDALLGAVADGDIGSHFPDTDATWKDADSLALMGRVQQRLDDLNGRIVNVDATVIAEKPRIASRIEAMREHIAGALNVSPQRVSVKGTTAEGMGALGRQEGIAALAIACVQQEE